MKREYEFDIELFKKEAEKAGLLITEIDERKEMETGYVHFKGGNLRYIRYAMTCSSSNNCINIYHGKSTKNGYWWTGNINYENLVNELVKYNTEQPHELATIRIYKAVYILSSDMKGDLFDLFEFKQDVHDDWEKRDYGYFRSSGWLTEKAEDEVQVDDYSCHVKNKKYFERELSKEEQAELETIMKEESIKALESKKQGIIEKLTKQIEYISK